MVRVVVIGLDGATWDLIKPWADKGELPTLKNLMDNGVWGDLESTIPPITCPAWISLLTGKNPGKLGIYYFRQPDLENEMEMKNVKINWDKYNPIWKILNKCDLKVNMINTPTVTPKRDEYKGVFVQCPIMGSENEYEFAYPNFVINKLKELKYERIIPNPNIIGEERYLRRLYEISEKKIDLALDLFENTEWDLFFFTLFYTDQIQHFFWKYMDPSHPKYKPSKFKNAILDYFKFVDNKINLFLGKLSSRTILLLVSDHGHGGMHKEVNYNFYLEEKGLLKFKKRSRTSRIINRRVLYNLTKKIKIDGFIKFLINKISILYSLKEKLPEGKITVKDIDWSQTLAYNPTSNTIFINLKGREKFGIVDIKDYEEIRKRIINILEELRDPETNEKVIKKIWKKEDIYNGEYFDKMPDIVIEPADETKYINYGFDGLGKGKLFSEPTPLTYSTHTLRGIFLAYGKGIKKGQKVNARIYDIAPTILHIFGLPIPNDMDGRVLMEIFEEDSEFARRKPKYVDPSYYEKGQEDEKIKKALKKAIKNLKLKGKI